MRQIVVLICTVILFFSCDKDPVFLPKPRMYPKITFPEGDTKTFETSYCNMTFEYPSYAEPEKDRYFFEGKPIDPCWFNIQFKDLAGTLYCSYIPIEDRAHYDKLINDSFRLVEEHNTKANFRQEEYIENSHGVGGLYFTLGGEVATNMQYVLTDTTTHFFRASLYFNSKVRPDSIKPIYEFVKADVDKMIESFKWKE